MGSLSNLYVSQSYQSLLHLATDSNITGSTGYISVEDGKGYPLGFAISASGDVLFSQSVQINDNLSVDGNFDVDGNIIISGTFDIEGKVTVNDDVRINGNLEVSGSTKLTGSLAITDAISASNMLITNNLNVGGTLFASKVVTLIESSSIIFSSGSNILGDATNDTQTLIGSVIMSGSSSLTGSMGITGNLNVFGNISSSTISGIGNVTTYSQSVDARLDIVEATASLYVPFSQSVDSRLDAVEATASFLNTTFSQSVDLRLDELENWSASLQTTFVTETQLTQTASFLQNQINQKLNTSSFNAYTQSYSQSVAVTTTGLNDRINTLSSFTGSYATTGSNTFNGNQNIIGSLTNTGSFSVSGSMRMVGNMVYSGSVRGQVFPITITSNTASMNCSLGNFFTLTLVSGSATRLTATNILPGETISLLVTQPVGSYGTLLTDSTIRFSQTSPYNATPSGSAIDVLSFQTYDTTTLYGAALNTMR